MTDKKRRIAIIPARGGSVRLPRKNIRIFHGRPILAYTIDAALASKRFERVVVSSEDEEILDVACRYGAEIHTRSMDLARDKSRVVDVCFQVLKNHLSMGYSYGVLACLYATAPMRTANDIQKVLDLLQHPKCNYAMAATEFSHYPHQAMKVAQNEFVEPMWPDLVRKRSDDVGAFVAGNGSTYCVDVSEFMRTLDFYGPGMRVHMMPCERSVDIDTEEDWRLAETLYSLQQNKSCLEI